MPPENRTVLAVNGGSSSIKFTLFRGAASQARDRTAEEPMTKVLSGKIERIGQNDTQLTYTDNLNYKKEQQPVQALDLSAAGVFLLDWLQRREGVFPLAAIGHRVVHGGPRTEACIVDDALLAELRAISAYDPDHLPGEIELMRLIRERYPQVPQIACFDTAFHTTLSPLAKLLPIPRRYEREGVRRYGFHGLSYAYILTELTRIAGPAAAGGKVIIAHLGSGASLAAVRDGVSIDTTMGFTPAGGIVMGTRPGDLDPGVIWYLLDKERFDPEKLDHFINHECGLLGVSETSSDMQKLLELESGDSRAAEAVGLFCYQVKKAIGAFAAVLGGVDALVFTGGIGEKSAVIRSRSCAGLGYLGIELDQRANEEDKVEISIPEGRAKVYVIPTDEESMIAQIVNQLL